MPKDTTSKPADAEKDKESESTVTYSLYDFLDDCPGLTGKIARYINSCLEVDQPGICLATALSFVSALKSERIKSGSILSPTLYTCAIADSGAGKSRAQQIVSQICVKCGIQDILMGRPASDAGILARLGRHNRQFLIWDEFGLALDEMSKSSNSYRVAIISTIMDLYSSAGGLHIGKEYAKDARVDIGRPYLAICAASTPGKFFSTLTRDFIENGFLNRWLVFDSEDSNNYRLPAAPPIPTDIIEDVLDICEGTPRMIGGQLGRMLYKEEFELAIDPKMLDIIVKNRWAKLKNSASPAEKTLWMRSLENTLKICMTLSELDGSCSDLTASYAWLLVEALTSNMIAKCEAELHDNKLQKTGADKARKFRDLIKRGETLTKSQLTKKSFGSGFTPRERKDYTEELIESGEWVDKLVNNPKTGRDITFYTRK